MLSIIFVIMLIIVIYRAAVRGVEDPKFTRATFIVGLVTVALTIVFGAVTSNWTIPEIILTGFTLVFVLFLRKIVDKLIDLYDLNHQVNLDYHDRMYTKNEVFDNKENRDDDDDDYDLIDRR